MRAVPVILIASSLAESQIPLPVCCDQIIPVDDDDYEEKCYNLFRSKWKGRNSNWEYRYSSTSCKAAGVGTFHEETKFEIDEFGKLVLTASQDSCGVFPPSVHQVNWEAEGENESNSQFCMDRVNNTFGAYICTESESSSEGTNYSDTPLLGQSICMIISAVFLVITCVILLTVKTRKNKNCEFVPYLVSQSTSLALAFVCDARLLFSPIVQVCWECMLAGYCVQYFFLAAFFWMNAFCLMMYMTMSRMKPGNIKNSQLARQRQRRFIRFSFYAWGMPLLITTTTFLLQMTITDPRMRPNLGVDSCFFRGGVIKWIYYDGPIAVVIMANMILFAFTASLLSTQHRKLMSMKGGRKHKSRLNKDMQYFSRFLKLFVVTGSGWVGEIIGSCNPNNTNPLVWYALKMADFFNSLQGVFIFFFFIYQDKVLFKRLFCIRKIRELSPSCPSEGIVLRCFFCSKFFGNPTPSDKQDEG